MTGASGNVKGRRVVLDGVLSPATCRELIMLARSTAVVGYRDCVCSATIFEIAAAAPALLASLVAAREAVRSAAEDALGLPMGLLVEFTGLISWRPGACIDWHHDANRPYLQQRAYSAVCYLNSACGDFEGGTFRFGGDSPGSSSGSTVAAQRDVEPVPGRMVAYSAQDVHSITPVTSGERFTLTLWFTEDSSHCEDTRLLAQLAGPAGCNLPLLPASMWLLPDGTDLRLCRLAMAGVALVCNGRLLCSASEGDDESAAEADGEDQEGALLRVQLAVQPAVLQAWLSWQRGSRQDAAAAPAGEAAAAPQAMAGAQATAATLEGMCAVAPALAGADQPAAGPAVQAADSPGVQAAAGAVSVPLVAEVVPGVQFSSVQEAVFAVQHWALQRGAGCASTRERVCCKHLCSFPSSASAQPQELAPSCSWLCSCQLKPSSRGTAAISTQGSSDGSLPGLQAALQELREAARASQLYREEQQARVQQLRPRWVQLGALFSDEG